MFDERKLLEEMRLASTEPGTETFETDQELERQGSPYRQAKQVVM
jgi:hypothetical protein